MKEPADDKNVLEIHPVDPFPADDIGLILTSIVCFTWILIGLLILKGIEKTQLFVNRLRGVVASPQDKDLHMFFFIVTMFCWLKVVSVSRLFTWLRMGISDGEPDSIWSYYRRLIEQFGLEQFLRDSDVELVDESKYGQLYSKKIKYGDEPLLLLCVTDATVRPCGEAPRYFLRVPPYMRTAKEAVAWTFGLSWRDYSPSIET